MNEMVERWIKTVGTAALLLCMIGASLLLMGSAVEKAPTQCRGFEFSAATTPVQSGADSTVNFQAVSGLGATASVLICNDGTATVDSDLIVSLSATTAAAPSDTGASTSFRLRPGDQFNLDGRWSRAVLRGATANVTARVIATW